MAIGVCFSKEVRTALCERRWWWRLKNVIRTHFLDTRISVKFFSKPIFLCHAFQTIGYLRLLSKVSDQILCAYLLNNFWRGEGVSAAAKNTWKLRQKSWLLCVGALLEVWHAMFYTRWTHTVWTHTVECVMTLLTDKAAQVINQWAKCLKFMVTHRIYINDRGIWKHLSFLISLYSINVDIIGWLHDILRIFNNCLKKFILIQNGWKCKVRLPFYDFQCQTRRRSNVLVI